MTSRQESGEMLRWQVLGVAPLLAVTPTVLQGGAIALAFSVVLLVTCGLASLSRDWLAPPAHLLFHLLVAAVTAAAVGYALGSVAPALREAMRWYLPLLAMNALILRQANGASVQLPRHALGSAIRVAAGVGACVMLIAAGREILATGTLCSDWNLIGGDCAWRLPLPLPALHLFAEPAGGLLALALLAAALAALRTRRAARLDR